MWPGRQEFESCFCHKLASIIHTALMSLILVIYRAVMVKGLGVYESNTVCEILGAH